jgi:hypothetical protein
MMDRSILSTILVLLGGSWCLAEDDPPEDPPRPHVQELQQRVLELNQRIEALETWRTEVDEYWTPQSDPAEWGHIGEIMRLWVHSAVSSAEWTRGLIERLEQGAYVMAGEGEREVYVLPEGEENPFR